MLNDKGKKLQEAGPATPVEILGLSGVPLAGDNFAAVGDERKARQIAVARPSPRGHGEPTAHHAGRPAPADRAGRGQGTPDDHQGRRAGLGRALAGVPGAAQHRAGQGERDPQLGGRHHGEPKAQKLAEQEHVDLRLYAIIYEAINQVRAAMEGLLEPTYVERAVGRVEVRQVFNISKVGTIAGSFVLDGKVLRDASVRLVRDGRVVHTGKIGSLRRFKNDVHEVQNGQECGIGLLNYNDIHQGDVFEIYELEQVATTL
jgi:translation initiation factor IF-2